MFSFVMFWAIIATYAAILFYAMQSTEKEKTEIAEHEAEKAREEARAIERWCNSSLPAKQLYAAECKVVKLERENEDLKEQVEMLLFENEELKKANRPQNYVLHTENFNELL